MSLRQIRLSYLVAIGVVVLVVLIGIITYIAWSVINRTVLDQFQAVELQLITSLSQQTQVSVTNFSSTISSLAVKDEIRATSATREEQARELLAQTAAAYPEGVIRSITRFDFRGNPRYAYPPELDAEIDSLEQREDYVYVLPYNLVEMTERGQRVTGELSVEFYEVQHRDSRQLVLLLIAPVDSVSLDTEYLVFELNLEPMFADLFSFVDLGETGQLWVLNQNSEIMYQARPSPTLDTTYRSYSRVFMSTLERPIIDTYDDRGVVRQAAIATAPALNERFIVFISRQESETQEGVTNNVISIFVFSVLAVLGVVGSGFAAGRYISRINQARQVEAQRQQTARFLLDVSRALNASLELPVVLERLLAEIQQLVPHDSASVLLLEEDELRVAASHGAGAEVEKLRVSEARAAYQVIETGTPLVIHDTDADSRWTHMAGIKIASWIGLPLRVGDQAVGVLNINSEQKNHFRQQDVEFAEAFADQASVAIQNARLHELERKQIEQELTIARGIQTSLLPIAPPDVRQIQIATNSLPASQVSGDFYQYIPLPDGRVGIAIGDVQGKGIPAALMMAVITTTMRDEVIRHQNPANLLQALNTRVLDRMQRSQMHSALIMATFNPRTYELEIANGGMVQPYLRPKGAEKFEFVPISGYPLGISENMKYTAQTLHFEPGSMLVMFSDGVLEARNAAGEFFGFERIEALLDALPEDVEAQTVIDRILQAVREYLGELSPQDDTTILVMRALPVTVPAAARGTDGDDRQRELIARLSTRPAASLSDKMVPAVMTSVDVTPERKNVELYLPSKLGFEKVARSTAGALAREIGFDDEKVEDIQTAVAEACMNAIEHGNAEDITEPVKVLMSGSEMGIEIRVTDSGKKLLSPDLPMPGVGDMRGWGLYFLKNLMDVFEVRQLAGGGNQVLLINYLNGYDSQQSSPIHKEEYSEITEGVVQSSVETKT